MLGVGVGLGLGTETRLVKLFVAMQHDGDGGLEWYTVMTCVQAPTRRSVEDREYKGVRKG